MTSAKCKFDWFKTKGRWGAKSPDDKKIVAKTATLYVLKGKLELDPKFSAMTNDGNTKGSNKGKQKKN
jgi:hypothetical protein